MNSLPNVENVFLIIIKFGTYFSLFIYIIFAVVLVKQVKVMTETLKVGFELQLKTIALIHLISALVILVISFFIL